MSQDRFAAARAAHQQGDLENAVGMYRALAEEGDARAQVCLAQMLRVGEGVAADTVEAFHWMDKSAEQGLGIAQFQLGMMYQFSTGTRQNLDAADHWYAEAGRRNAEDAEANRATLALLRPLLPHLQKLSHRDLFMLEAGVVRPDTELAVRNDSAAARLCREMAEIGWLEPVAGNDATASDRNVFRMTAAGQPAIVLALETLRVSPEWLAPRAQEAEAHSIFAVSTLLQASERSYLESKSLDGAFAAYEKRDFSSAIPILRALADHGDPVAQFSLGSMISRGEGVAADDVLALAWYRKSAEQGFGPSQHNVGLFTMSGRGAPQDLEAAAVWLRKSADQGEVRAETDLAILIAATAMLPMMNQLTLGDHSVLELLSRAPADTSTVEGSAKHPLYLEMEKHSWLKQVPPPSGWPMHNTVFFQSTELGCVAIPKAMAMHAAWPNRRIADPPDRDEPRWGHARVLAWAKALYAVLDRASDPDVSPLRRIATPVLVSAVVIFPLVWVLKLLGWRP